MPPAVQQSHVMEALMVAALALCVVDPVLAQQSNAFVVPYTGTLKKVNESGVMRIGYRENSPPFAFLDAKGSRSAIRWTSARWWSRRSSRSSGKDIRVEYRPVTPENRFDLLNSGAIDLECGSTTNNFERRKVAAFSPTMFVTGTKLLVRRGSGIRYFRDLQGKTVVLTRGTVQATGDPQARRAAEARHQVRDRGGPQAVVRDARLRQGRRLRQRRRAALRHARRDEVRRATFRVVGDFLTYADYALMLRKDDPEFAEVVERAFAQLAGSREIVAIYEKWFLKPLPSGVRLNLPMSPHLEELFRVQGLPTD